MVLGLVVASVTFSAVPKSTALISTAESENISTISVSDSPLLARRYRRVRYRSRRRGRRYRVCSCRYRYRYRYGRRYRYRYRVCRYYRRYYR